MAVNFDDSQEQIRYLDKHWARRCILFGALLDFHLKPEREGLEVWCVLSESCESLAIEAQYQDRRIAIWIDKYPEDSCYTFVSSSDLSLCCSGKLPEADLGFLVNQLYYG